MICRLVRCLALLIICCLLPAMAPAQSDNNDPILRAMSIEMERSSGKLKLEQMPAPYYIEYRVTDMETMVADASYGALRSNVHARVRFLRVVVRVGDYKQDSFFEQGQGVVEIVPIENDVAALRHQIWLATDQAYKAATQALSAKKAKLKQYQGVESLDDFAHADPGKSIQPTVQLTVKPEPWQKMLQAASDIYRTDPQIQSFNATLNFQAINRYFMNSEGAQVRSGQALYEMTMAASTQASDGMRLNRSWAYTVNDPKELPAAAEFIDRAKQLRSSLQQLRNAPISEEEYRGPVLFSADAAASVLLQLVGTNVLGIRPELGKPARTTGAWATAYNSRVLPDFMSVMDDPTITSLAGKSLMGHYDFDDEGVKAAKVPLVENGKLINYLMGREPIRDFLASNGHGRAKIPTNYPGPSLGNLIVSSSEAVSPEGLKKKLIELCRQRELPYGYYVETMGGASPRLLYRIYANDGHQELVRGAAFGDLDVRSLRNDLIAAGNDVNVENHTLNTPLAIVNPSLLFDELEVKRANADKEALPEYPAPAAAPGK
jgi:predicted Zn-dependent protease